MSGCMLCPRECGADRVTQPGWCGALARPNIARGALHFWEEPSISGTRGSGAIFFSGCNMACVFCQNRAINHTLIGPSADGRALCDMMLSLEKQGAHNINLVSPAPFINVIADAIPLARESGLKIPVVYNTNAYEKTESIKRLDGLIDIYLPDLKYVSAAIAQKYSKTADYFMFAAPAIKEMYIQCGLITKNDDGIAQRGVIIRHLVLPGSVDETRRVIDYIVDEYPPEIDFSLMGQYAPPSDGMPSPLNRKLLRREYDRAIDYALQKGMRNVLIQHLSSASTSFTPEFNGTVI